MKQIRLLSFDLDDTLWPCTPTIVAAEEAHYAWIKHNVPIICSHYSIQELREKRLQLYALKPNLSHDLSELRKQSLLALANEFDLEIDWIEPAFDAFDVARQQVTLFEDVKTTLDALVKDYQLIALTNGNADIYKTGVGHWFSFCLHSAEAGAQKSEPDIYHQALDKAGFCADQMLHIGDDPEQDVLGAKKADVKAVWLNRKGNSWNQSVQPDGVIKSLHELPELLKQM